LAWASEGLKPTRICLHKTVHDCGRPINPMPVEGQLEGPVVGGMGQARYEDVIVENGQVMNPSFLDFGFPTFLEMPQIEAIEVETDDPSDPSAPRKPGRARSCRRRPRLSMLSMMPLTILCLVVYATMGLRWEALSKGHHQFRRAFNFDLAGHKGFY
jgi:hypothetical protein